MASLIGFTLFGLSFLQFSADGAGSFIALDAASVLYFLIYPRRLMRNSSTLVWFSWGLLCLISTRIFMGVNEFPFLARVSLIFIDAFFLKELFRPYNGMNQEVMCSRALWLAAVAYALVFSLWLLTFDGVDSIFYFNNLKSWIATFPALFAVSQLTANRPKHSIFWALTAISLSFFDSSTSRALLLQSVLLLLMALWQMNRRIAKLAILLVLIISLLSLSALDAFVEKHDHSNTFRLIMIMQIVDFSWGEIIIGRGIDLWRLSAFNALYEMPGAENFFESANPHFFPAEIIIRGGIAFFVCICGSFYVLFRRSQLVAVPAVMLFSTFFTTNTGVERLYMTLGIFVLISVLDTKKVGIFNPKSVEKNLFLSLDDVQSSGAKSLVV